MRAMMPEKLREWGLVTQQGAGCREDCILEAEQRVEFGDLAWVITHRRQDRKGFDSFRMLTGQFSDSPLQLQVWHTMRLHHARWYSEGLDRAVIGYVTGGEWPFSP